MNAANEITQDYDILLIEDSPTDVLLTKQALEDLSIESTLHVVEDGIKAIEFLRQQGVYADKPRPKLILLDLNLPRKNGLEVLMEIKNDDELKFIPVVVLTTSRANNDVTSSYDLHANCFVQKPVEFQRLIEVIQSINLFWLRTATLPNL